MIITLTEADRIVHQADCDHSSGVPVTWALVLEGNEEDTFSVLYRDTDDDEPWRLEWRGSFEKCRERYEENVTEAVLGNLLNDLPVSANQAMAQANALK